MKSVTNKITTLLAKSLNVRVEEHTQVFFAVIFLKQITQLLQLASHIVASLYFTRISKQIGYN